MEKHRQTEKQYSLKDILFNRAKVRQLASEIKGVCPDFVATSFETAVVSKFKDQELMERVRNITAELRAHLPQAYPEAMAVILEALPPPLDDKENDNDFGDFIYIPYSYFVATYGCTAKHVALSLKSLKEITKRASAEAALRDFLNAFPVETLKAVEGWSHDNNYHVRRLASEGTRPNLPWAKRITVPPKKLAPILDYLHKDRTRYVVRSVANHMNDLSKVDKNLVIKLLKKWRREKKQNEKELQYLTNHSLRTLIKDGDNQALKLIGFDSSAVKVESFKMNKTKVKIGDGLEFKFDLISTTDKSQNILVDYRIYFLKANGKLAPKTFKLTKKELVPKATLSLVKKHPLKLMSTRTLYPGRHRLELQVNGRVLKSADFTLVA